MKRIIFLALVFTLITQVSWAARAKIDNISQDPYVAALAIDADTGEVLFEQNSGVIAYPASVLKLMVLLVMVERIEQGTLKLDEMVQVTREAAQMGGSQVYLDPKEQFSIEDLLYALIIQSANDAAVALAMHVAGSKDGFVSLMNKRAEELGMKDTRFYSVHGLPPSEGQKPDQTTANDLAILGRELAKNPDVFKYTSTRERGFRDGEFMMRTHNHLLTNVDGCDGFKTGYFKAAGFSIIATAKRNGVRIIAIVLGSKDRKVRDAKASELLSKGFSAVPPREDTEVIVSKSEPVQAAEEQAADPEPRETPIVEKDPANASRFGRDILMFGLGLGTGLVLCLVLAMLRSGRSSRRHRRIV